MISSDANAQIKEIVKLQKSARERKKKQQFLVEGIKLTKEAGIYSKLQKIYFMESVYEKVSDSVDSEMMSLIEECEYEVVSDSVFKGMSDTVTPQGVLGLVKMPVYSLEEMLLDSRRSFLLLDDLRDPGNLGTIMRTAEGADMSGVILSKESVDLFNPKTVRSTMGAIFRVPFYYAEDLVTVIEMIKAKELPVYGTMMQGSERYDRLSYTNGAGIVVGNEANGISERVQAALTKGVRIPMGGKLESLNAAVAAGILMYESARQRWD